MDGPARALAAAYAVFALAAGARASAQLATHAGRAPLAYGLSALAAAVYLVAGAGLRRGDRRVVVAACAFELAGVLCVGSASRLAPEAFPDQTVWSGFGEGYGYLPLLLPVLGLFWALRPLPRRPLP